MRDRSGRRVECLDGAAGAIDESLVERGVLADATAVADRPRIEATERHEVAAVVASQASHLVHALWPVQDAERESKRMVAHPQVELPARHRRDPTDGPTRRRGGGWSVARGG